MMQPTGPQLRDIHLPPAPAWWPPAPGWWMLAVLVLLLIGGAVWFARKHRRVLRQRRAVMSELDRVATQYEKDADAAALITALHQLLRRVARRHDLRATQQGGEAWRRTLSRVPLDESVLDRLVALDQWLYRPPAELDHAAAIGAVRSWLHKALKPGCWKTPAREPADA
jgi:type VI protein secretion system component VasK